MYAVVMLNRRKAEATRELRANEHTLAQLFPTDGYRARLISECVVLRAEIADLRGALELIARANAGNTGGK